ncbi:MAG: hypothetical protein KGY75_09390 [Candidatus Cloacimonetes bacterium]|nr:hypothetical protein [Candidatus Cloacimonadota bacterium]MBS3768313.1 hypothetical protein [Candidatus Cloacimonadota bacterium]
MKKIILIIGLICCATFLQAQSTFLDIGQSGIRATAFAQESYWEDGFMGSLGYSFNGTFDISAWAGSYKYDHMQAGGDDIDQTETAYGANITWWFKRCSPGYERLINIGIRTGYEYEEYKVDDKKSATSNGFEGCAVFAINFDICNMCAMQPFYSLGYSMTTMEEEASGDKEDYNGAISSYGVNLVRNIGDNTKLHFTFETDNDALHKTNDVAYEFGAGVVYGF